jgi:replicative DNA helicase
MSYDNDSTNKLIERQKEISALEDKRKAIAKIETDQKYKRLIESEKKQSILKNYNLNDVKNAYISDMINSNDEYMENAKKRMFFIAKEFDRVVPWFPRNIVLIGAKTGEGKSTCTANIAFHTLRQQKKVLILTNEEKNTDIYNRITCLIKGWAYTNHNEFTDEQKETFRHNIKVLSQFVDVIEDTMPMQDPDTGEVTTISGVTTTFEGITGVLEGLINNGIHYDAIIVDYVQKVSMVESNPKASVWEASAKFMHWLDGFKNRYSAPIAVMSQLHSDKENKKDFQERIKGLKAIMDHCTCAMEMRSNPKEYQTEFVMHKNRWHGDKTNGQGTLLGWHRGKFVSKDDPEWNRWVIEKRAERIAKAVSGR